MFVCSYENDPDLFMFDYREDLLTRAVERDRVFTLNKVQEKEEDDEDSKFAKENKKRAKKLLKDEVKTEDVVKTDEANVVTSELVFGGQQKAPVAQLPAAIDDDYDPKPERTSYAQEGIAKKFGGF